MKGTSVHIKNMRIKQLCSPRVRDFAMALRARKVSRAFEKRAPGELSIQPKIPNVSKRAKMVRKLPGKSSRKSESC